MIVNPSDEDGLLFLARGVFIYYTEEQMKKFFITAPDYFENYELYFYETL